MTLLEIVESYLKSNGFGGLYSPGECACKVGDLFPCGEPRDGCTAGYVRAADPDENESGGDWVITPDKPAPPQTEKPE